MLCPVTKRKMQNNTKKSVLLLDIYREPLYNDVLMSIVDERLIVITGRKLSYYFPALLV